MTNPNSSVSLPAWGLTIAFAAWAAVVGFSSKLIMDRLEKIENEVGAGVLPRADERLRQLEMEMDVLIVEIRLLRQAMNSHMQEDHQ